MFWRKKDHSSAIEKIVVNLVSNGEKTGVLPWLSIKDAIRYSYTKQEQPLIANKNTVVQCQTIIDGTCYNIFFQSHPEKGVYLHPTKWFDVED